jgi:uncharacterized membrane protein YhaH (DUF805 family)
MTMPSRFRCGLAWIKARFSFQGRATRLEFWLCFPFALLCFALGLCLTLALFTALSRTCAQFHVKSTGFLVAGAILLVLLDGALYIWLCLAAAIRRTHDLGYSYRDSLNLRVNVMGGFKRGTIGPNEYGPDPLQKATPPA